MQEKSSARQNTGGVHIANKYPPNPGGCTFFHPFRPADFRCSERNPEPGGQGRTYNLFSCIYFVPPISVALPEFELLLKKSDSAVLRLSSVLLLLIFYSSRLLLLLIICCFIYFWTCREERKKNVLISTIYRPSVADLPVCRHRSLWDQT